MDGLMTDLRLEEIAGIFTQLLAGEPEPWLPPNIGDEGRRPTKRKTFRPTSASKRRCSLYSISPSIESIPEETSSIPDRTPPNRRKAEGRSGENCSV
jgi:hypothetical protein